MGDSCKKLPQFIMMIKLSILSIILFSLASSTPLPSKEEQARGSLEDIIIGQIQNQINNLLGITTTRGTPILDLAGGILGGGETTTPPPQESGNLIQTLLGLLFPTTTPATTTTSTTTEPPTTTTEEPTTTKCGGLIGGGLLC